MVKKKINKEHPRRFRTFSLVFACFLSLTFERFRTFLLVFALSGKERKTHKHKQICGIVPGLGGWQNFVYVFFPGHSLWGRKTHKQNPPKSWDNPVKIWFLCF